MAETILVNDQLTIWEINGLLGVGFLYIIYLALSAKPKKGEIRLEFFRYSLGYTAYLRLIIYCFLYSAVIGLGALLLSPYPRLYGLRDILIGAFVISSLMSLIFLLFFAIEMFFIVLIRKIKDYCRKVKKQNSR